MAITKTFLDGDFSRLQAFLESLGLFDSVTSNISSSTASVTCKDSDNNTLLTITGNNLSTSNASYSIRAYKDASHYTTVSYSTQAPRFESGLACSNGGIIRFQPTNSAYSNYQASILLTKTNNDKVACVFSSAQSTQYFSTQFSSFYAIAWGDDIGLTATRTMSENSGNQTILLPFATDAVLGQSSYTPHAYYSVYGQYYSAGYGVITIDGVDYITNSRWAIEDEEDAG